MAVFEVTVCPVCKGGEFAPFLKCKDHFVSGEEFQIVECTGCGFKITSQAPGEDSVAPYYQSEDYISHSNTSKGLVNRVYHLVREFMLGKKRKSVVKSLGRKEGTLLDIGAGTGFFVSHMKNFGWDVVGTEKSPEARGFAKNEFGVELLPTEELFGMKHENFDAITLWHVLEHIHDLQGNIKAIKGILKPGGILMVALPNHTSFDAKHYRNFWAAYDVPRHLWHFAPAQVKTLFENGGFRLVKKYRMPFDSFYISMMSEKYKKSQFGLIKGLCYGKISWLASLFNKDRCSSVIYAFKKG
jgi:SAM-dependent methyltransferase